MQQRKIGGEVLLHNDLFLAQLVPQDHQRRIDTLVHIDILLLTSALIGVRLDRMHQVGDPPDALFDGAHQLHARGQRTQPAQRVR